MNKKYSKLVKQASSLYKELNDDVAPYVQYQDGLVDMFAVGHCERILDELKSIYHEQTNIELSS